MAKDGVAEVVAAATVRLSALESFTAASIESALRAMLEELGIGAKKGLQPLRVAVTGSAVSPPLFESMAALGKDTTLSRLHTAASRIG